MIREVIYVSFRLLEKRSANTLTEAPKIIRRILEHIGLWLANARPIPKVHSPPVHLSSSEAFFSELPAFGGKDFSQIPHGHRDC
jgi:hypothetical protein